MAAGLVVATVCAAGCGSAKPGSAPVAGGPGSSSGTGGGGGTPSGLSPQKQAAQAERTLLALFASIPGAKVAAPPQYNVSGTQASESWQLSVGTKAAFDTAVARLPHWKRIGGETADNLPAGQYREIVQTTSASATLAQQSVDITVTPTGGRADASTLEVDVEADYRPVKPAAERIPDSAVLIVGPVTPSAGKKVITSASTIAQIAADLNALPTLAAHGVYACPALLATPSLDLTFAPSADAPASASTVALVPSRPGGFCAPGVQVTVNGTSEPQLDNSVRSDLFTQLEKLTGVTVPNGGPLR